jgi:DNA-binding transcriptional LysR family regulator
MASSAPDVPHVLPLLGRLKLRQLALVAAIDTHRSLRKAAEAVAVTQPAATRLLHELEQALGVPLFVRHAWGMEPTGYGDAFVRHSRSLLSEVAEAQLELRSLATGARGVLRVGGVTGAVPRWLSPAVIAVRTERPALRVGILVNTSDVLAEALLAGTLDVAIGRLPATADARLLQAEPLAEEPLCIVARTGHPLQRRPSVGAADLGDATWILQPPGSPARLETDAMFDRMGLRAGLEVIETASIVATLALLRASDALSVVPADLAAHYGAPGWLGRLGIATADAGSRYQLLSRRGRPLGVPAQAFVAAIRALARGPALGRRRVARARRRGTTA